MRISKFSVSKSFFMHAPPCKRLSVSALKLIVSDIQRFENKKSAFISASFPVLFWFRIGSWFYRKNRLTRITGIPIYLIYKFHKLLSGIQIPLCTSIGPGFRIFHYNCIILSQESVIGSNCSIHQGVTIGRCFNGCNAGCPIIGDNVVIFAGAKIIGKVRIGNNAVIGANAVVVKDVPDNCVVAGMPAKVISDNASKCFDEHWAKIFAQNE